MKALILAGGLGTRLRELSGDLPKPMISVAGKPFIEYIILNLRDQGIKEVVIAVHHMADKIKSYFGSGNRWEVDITYSEEEEPLGTGGAIKKAEKYLDDTFLVLNGDSYCNFNLKDFVEFHNSKRSKATLLLTKVSSEEAKNFGSVILNENKIVDFSEKSSHNDEVLVNCGVYLFEPTILDYIPSNKKVSIEDDIFPVLANSGLLCGYRNEGYFSDIGRPETYKKFKKDVLETLFLPIESQVKEAMQKIKNSGLDIVFIVDSQKRLLGVLTNSIINRFILNGGKVEDLVSGAMVNDPLTANINDSQEKITRILASGTNKLPILDDLGRIVDVEFRIEKIKTEAFPVLRGRAPLRISFAGGGTDLPYFFEKYGGVVVNSTIDKYCYATIVKRADKKIIIDSDITPEADVIINSINDIKYDGKFDLIKSVINLLKPDFGFELYLHNDLPGGRGLGSSASAAVLITKLISDLQNKHYNDYKIAELAHKAEIDELRIKGGYQDQYVAVTGGFNFMEFNQDKTLIYPLRLKDEIINELSHHLLLCYVGKSHFSGEQHKSQERSFLQNETEVINSLNELKKITFQIRDCLLTDNMGSIGDLLHKSWENKKKVSQAATNPFIDKLYEAGLANGSSGGKLLGSGGGGYLLFFYSPKKRNRLKTSLEKEGGEILDFNFESKGTQIWRVKENNY